MDIISSFEICSDSQNLLFSLDEDCQMEITSTSSQRSSRKHTGQFFKQKNGIRGKRNKRRILPYMYPKVRCFCGELYIPIRYNQLVCSRKCRDELVGMERQGLDVSLRDISRELLKKI